MEDQSLDIEITDGGFTEEQINAAANATAPSAMAIAAPAGTRINIPL